MKWVFIIGGAWLAAGVVAQYTRVNGGDARAIIFGPLGFVRFSL